MIAIGPVSAVRPVAAVTEVGRARAVQGRAGAAPHPFWEQLNGRIASSRCDAEKFDLLAALADRQHAMPPLAGAAPPMTLLRLQAHELACWTREQPPEPRGRLHRLLLGANVGVPWHHHLLQREGRFSGAWRQAMDRAAREYVQAVSRDPLVLELLRCGPQVLTAAQREALAAALMRHASRAWRVAMPRVRVVLRGAPGAEGEPAAETRFEEPPAVVFHAVAFEHGAIELVATAFHECIHVVQIERLRQRHEPGDEDFHADVLALSFEHLRTRHLQRGDPYHLYRHAAEAEREAHLGALQVALLAASSPRLHPQGEGSLGRIGAPCDDPGAAVLAWLEDEAGLRVADLGALAGKAAGQAGHAPPTQHALARRAGMPAPLPACWPPAGADAACSAQADRAWAALTRLQALRDPADRSGMLAHAVLAGAQEAFFSGSDESAFLQSVVLAALDARGPSLVEHARRELARRFGAGLRAEALHDAWHTWRSALSRRIVLECVRQGADLPLPLPLPLCGSVLPFTKPGPGPAAG